METKKPNQNETVANSFFDAPSVYVGTYAKYNSGSIDGAWVNLIGHDQDSFYALCRTIHADENDPELMFQDYENFPSEFYGESGLSDKLWEWLNLDEHDRELLARYADAIGDDSATIEDARDALAGTARSEADFAEELAGESEAVPGEIASWIVIDWTATWNCNLRYDYSTSTADDGEIWFFRQ